MLSLSRFVPVAAVVAAVVFGLSAIFQPASANEAAAGQPACCVVKAACCEVPQPCCLGDLPQPQAGGLVGQNTAVQGMEAAVVKPSCCLKNAYCCQVRQPCCRQAVSGSTEATVEAEAVATEASDAVARPSCCAKHAYCCWQKKPCCR